MRSSANTKLLYSVAEECRRKKETYEIHIQPMVKNSAGVLTSTTTSKDKLTPWQMNKDLSCEWQRSKERGGVTGPASPTLHVSSISKCKGSQMWSQWNSILWFFIMKSWVRKYEKVNVCVFVWCVCAYTVNQGSSKATRRGSEWTFSFSVKGALNKNVQGRKVKLRSDLMIVSFCVKSVCVYIY